MTDESNANGTTNEVNVPSVPRYMAATKSLKPGAEAPVSFRVKRACNVVDVAVDVPGEVALVALGSRRVVIDEATPSLRAALAAEPYEAPAGSYIVVRVRNTGEAAVEIGVGLVVDGEHGEEAAPRIVHDLSGVARAAAPTGGGAADGSLATVTSLDVPVQEIVTTLQPGDGQRVVVMFRTYADALHQKFTVSSPLKRFAHAGVLAAFDAALERGEEAASVGSGDVGIELSASLADRVVEALRFNVIHELEPAEIDAFVIALEQAFVRCDGDTVNPLAVTPAGPPPLGVPNGSGPAPGLTPASPQTSPGPAPL